MERLADLTDRILQERQTGRAMRGNDAGQSVARAAFCNFKSKADPAFRGQDPTQVCRAVFPSDHRALSLLKSAVSPGSTTSAGAGAELVGETVGQFLASLAPASAIAALIPAGVNVDLQSTQEINLPFRTTSPSPRPWVAEGSPIAVTSATFGHLELTAGKLGVIAIASRELLRRSDAEAIFTTMLREDASLSLDAAYLSTSPASTGALAGLLYDVTPTPVGMTATTPRNQMADDLAALASAVATNGFGSVVFVMSPARAIRAQILAPELRVTILPSLAVPAGRVIAIDSVSIAHGFGLNPDLVSTNAATIHMSDDPLPIRTGGVTADPVRSTWQTNAVATRMLLDVGFAKRRSDAVAYADNVGGW